MTATQLAAKAPEERRERILRATVSVIRERGFAGTRVSDIAREAGTSQGLILYHFGSLEGALAAAVTLSEAEFLRDVAAELQAAAGPLEKLRVIAELVPGEGPAVSDWQLWLELWARAIRDDAARNVRASLDAQWREWLRSILAEGVARGDFVCSDIESSALRLASLADGLAIPLALGDSSVTSGRFRDLWLGAAALEIGLPVTRLLDR